MSPLIALAFFLSGFAGLVYETIWARYLGLFLGHRAYSQVLVLVIFLAPRLAPLGPRRRHDVSGARCSRM
jgi:hypothetical protein